MGEGTNRVEPAPSADELAERVERSRERLDTLVTELDQRRHIVARVRHTLATHQVWVAAAAVVVAGAVAAVVQLSLRRHRQQQSWRGRAGRLAEALSRMVAKPERVATRAPDLPGKVLTTVATTLTGMLIKRAGEQALASARDQSPRR